jgi:putative ABC transport system substrate-binding protein
MDSIHGEARQMAASRLGIEIREIVVPEKATLAMAVDAIRKSRSDALVIWKEPPGLVAFLEKARIPACGLRFAFAQNGGLLAVSFDWEEGDKQAVAIVARILRGESPATIPVYQHNDYGFAVNLRTARAMGITIPASIRIQATEVIE